jgi:hypothetical protein
MDLIVGVGEIGTGIRQLLEMHQRSVAGVDLDPLRCFGTPLEIDVLHVCFPYSGSFLDLVEAYVTAWQPVSIVIHSTVKPGTTHAIHQRVPERHVIYSPVRGVHARLQQDLARYTKCYALYPPADDRFFRACFVRDCGLTVQRFSTPVALELAKLVIDTSYYGWLITYGQLVDKACHALGVDYDEVWSFSEEVHQFLGNRPKTYVDPQGIGGHCVLPNLDLLEDIVPEIKEIIHRINRETIHRYQRVPRD